MQQELEPLLHKWLPPELIYYLNLKPKTPPVTESLGSESFSSVFVVKLAHFLWFLPFKKGSSQTVQNSALETAFGFYDRKASHLNIFFETLKCFAFHKFVSKIYTALLQKPQLSGVLGLPLIRSCLRWLGQLSWGAMWIYVFRGLFVGQNRLQTTIRTWKTRLKVRCVHRWLTNSAARRLCDGFNRNFVL